MKTFLVRFFAVIGALATVGVLVALAIALLGALAKPRVPAAVALALDLERPVVEYQPDDPFAQALLSDAVPLRDILDGLERAAADDRVKVLVAELGAVPMGMATAQEIRDAVIAFRASGKKAIAFAETFGEFAPGNTSYFLATGFDEIVLQPSGDIGLNGVLMESMFFAGTLEKLGVQPRMDHRYEYKNAMNTFTEKAYTSAHEEAMLGIATSWHEQLIEAIASSRGKSADEVRALIDRGPYLGTEAVEAGLVDRTGYWDEVTDLVEEAAGSEITRQRLGTYLERAGRPHTKGDTIALVYGTGGVQRGKSKVDPLSGGFTMGSDTVAKALRDAVDDDAVKAILFRVDSPGGSYVASDAIWRETVRAKEAGKPIIVSMGNVAGSGGYFVAMAADKIVAQPGTITGSIGVLAGKMLTQGMWDKLGISWDEVHHGSAATMWSGLADYDEHQWARFQAWLDRIYLDFTTKVAEGRGKTQPEVHEIAKGRIWSGSDAKRIGLVDELGGMDVALRLAREAAGLAADAPINLKQFPQPRTPFEALMAELGGEEDAATVALVETLETVRPLVHIATEAGLRGEVEVLTTPLPAGVR